MLQYAAARFYSTEAASCLVPEIVQDKGRREFENTSIAAQVSKQTGIEMGPGGGTTWLQTGVLSWLTILFPHGPAPGV
jgi:hypothetical protein